MTFKSARGFIALWSVWALVLAALSGVWVGVGNGADPGDDAASFQATFRAWRNRDELEEELFDLLWRCDSPLTAERERAMEELTRRFAEFEPISSTRAFLTNGEISLTARDAFLDAEARYYDRVVTEQTDGFVFSRVAVDEPNAAGRRTVDAELTTPERVRVVYLVPDLSRYAFVDPKTSSRWLPTAPYAAPELQPTSQELRIELEATLQEDRGDPCEGATSCEIGFETLVGCDLRPIAIPLGVSDAAGDKEYRVGELTYSAARATASDARRLAIDLSFRYDEPYDAFDSHRVWIIREDFALALEQDDETTILAPIAFKEVARKRSGATLQISFELPKSSKFDARSANEWTLLWRAPRRLVFFRKR